MDYPMLAAMVSALGLMGGAYCDATAKRSSKAPNINAKSEAILQIEVEVTFAMLGDLDAKICVAALPTLFIGVGFGILTTGVLYYKVGRFV